MEKSLCQWFGFWKVGSYIHGWIKTHFLALMWPLIFFFWSIFFGRYFEDSFSCIYFSSLWSVSHKCGSYKNRPGDHFHVSPFLIIIIKTVQNLMKPSLLFEKSKPILNSSEKPILIPYTTVQLWLTWTSLSPTRTRLRICLLSQCHFDLTIIHYYD